MNSWKEECVYLLEILGGEGTLTEIYETFLNYGTRPYVNKYDSCIRSALQAHTRGCNFFNGEELFVMPSGKHSGRWALKNKYPNIKQQTLRMENISLDHFKQETKKAFYKIINNYYKLSKVDREVVDERIALTFIGEMYCLMYLFED